jgi:hypothetical protein
MSSRGIFPGALAVLADPPLSCRPRVRAVAPVPPVDVDLVPTFRFPGVGTGSYVGGRCSCRCWAPFRSKTRSRNK